MSAREELAQLVAQADSYAANDCGGIHWQNMADKILAAGYSKPRTITTVDELNTLPQGTKLYSSKTTHSWHLNDLSHPHGGTRVQGTGGGYTYLEDFIKHEAPLTVLYSPASQ